MHFNDIIIPIKWTVHMTLAFLCITLEMEVCSRTVYLCVSRCDAIMERTYLRESYHASHTHYTRQIYSLALWLARWLLQWKCIECHWRKCINVHSRPWGAKVWQSRWRRARRRQQQQQKICCCIAFLCLSGSGFHLRPMLAKPCHTNYDFIHHVYCVIV